MYPKVLNLPSNSSLAEKLTVLSASPCTEDHAALRRILDEGGGWNLERTQTLAETLRSLYLNPAVILCERFLPDGSWKDLLRELSRRDFPARLVVTSGQADEVLWAEVLNMGGYDVLMKPFDHAEVTRVLRLAASRRRPARSAAGSQNNLRSAAIFAS
jgi:FixJ family two-component response regulator